MPEVEQWKLWIGLQDLVRSLADLAEFDWIQVADTNSLCPTRLDSTNE